MSNSLQMIRENLARAGGRIWSLNTQIRRHVLRHLTVSGPSEVADLLPEGLVHSGINQPMDVIDWYLRWVGAHISCGERPVFDLSDSAMCDIGPRVLLVSPVYRLKETSIGLVRIAFFLRGLGIHADWVAATPDNIESILQQAYYGSYHVIGHGTTHYTFAEDIKLLMRMAEMSPASRFILGGHGAVFEPAMLRRLLTETPVSYIVRGLGERSTARLTIAHEPDGFVSALQPDGIRGIHFLHKGEVLSTGIDEYNELEFRGLHAIFDGRLYPVEGGVTRLITSTHCSFACVFCSSRNFPDQSVVRLTPSDVAHTVGELRCHHPELHSVEFNDDNFTIGYRRSGRIYRGKEWIDELCTLATKAFNSLQTYCYSRADTMDQETLARLVKDINLAKIGIGLEHVDHYVLKAMKKGNAVQHVLERIRQALELGIDTNFFVILFSKWETRSTLIALLDVSIRLALEGAHVVYNWGLQPLRGADVSKDPSNQYLGSQLQVGTFQFEQLGKIVPDDQEIGSWFRRMNDDLETYFALQDELLARVVNFGSASHLDVRSAWLQRVFREHRNVNLSNTLTNLVRFHSMFEYGRRFINPDDLYFIEGASRTWGGVLAYVFNGPTCPRDGSATSIQRKIDFLSGEVNPDWTHGVDNNLAVELDVVRIGMRAPDHYLIAPNSWDHCEWAQKAMPRWRKSITTVDSNTEGGSYAVAALSEIEGLLDGRHPQRQNDCRFGLNGKNRGFIL